MDLCRLCGINTSFKILCELKDSDLMIEQKLERVFNLKLKNEKLLPQMVCRMCIVKLENSLEFLELIERSQEKLMISLSDQINSCEDPVLSFRSIQMEGIPIDPSEFLIPSPSTSSLIFIDELQTSQQRKSQSLKKARTFKKCGTQAITVEDIFPKELSEGIFESAHNLLDIPENEKNPDGTLSEVGKQRARERGWERYDWKCVECEGIFDTSECLETHFKADHSKARILYACMDCPKTFKMHFGLLNHAMDDHRPHMKFFCDICSDYRWTLIDLYKHRKEFHPKNKNTCLYCGRMFHIGFNLKHHVSIHKVFSDDQLLICDFCGTKVHTKTLMQRHISYHHVWKKHVCEHCGKAYSLLGDLTSHKVIHSTERPFACSICEKRFKDKKTVRIHKRTHFPEDKTVECNVCGMKFHTKGKLNRHFRVHLDVYQYSCDFCSRQFKHASGFKTHRRIHTGERPYVCSYEGCGQRFIDGPNMNKHMKSKHSNDALSRKKQLK